MSERPEDPSMGSKLIVAVALGLGALAYFAPAASAHPPGGHYPHRSGYGVGAHDLVPHWHKTYTPFGPTYWYGLGAHDFAPHKHSVGPFGDLRSHSWTPYGPTTSYHGLPGPGGYGRPYGAGYGGFRRW
jgi:hypothetical protein